MSANWGAIRAEFPALANWTYLNTATFGQVPERSRQALDRHFERRNQFACADFLEWFDDMDRIRALVGRLINCAAEDIGFVSNACSALSLLLGGIEWQAGDQILTLTDEFPNQFYYGEFLGAQGVELVEARPEDLLGAVTDRTRVVALSTVNYINGYFAPVQEIAAFLRGRGILFFVDGTQSVGAHRFDIAAVRPDMFAVNAYKWMVSPNGAGFLYVHPELRAKLDPSVIGWRSDKNWRSVDNLHRGKPEFPEGAEKYEGGMLNFSALYAMGDTIEMMLDIGPEHIEARVLELAARVRTLMRGMGATVEYEGSAIVAARFPGVDASALARGLRERRVIVAARHGLLRVSPHFYNDESDLKAFEEALQRSSIG
jgi:cysteine desulfurase/selenocysteine lyase